MKRIFNLLTVVGLSTVMSGLLPSCGGKSDVSVNYQEAARCVAIDGSIQPVMAEELQIFHVKKKLDPIYPLFIDEQEAVEKLLNNDLFIVFITRKLTQQEENIVKGRHYRARQEPAAYDALALIVNNENTIGDTITTEQFEKILTGEAQTWKELFPDSAYADTIRVAFDSPRSSTVRFCNDSILRGRQMKVTGNVRAQISSPAVIDYVEAHKNAIGIVGSNWLNNNRDTTNLTYGRHVKVVAVGPTRKQAVTPEQYYIYTREYPFIRTIWTICTDPRDRGTPRRLHNFVLDASQQGQGQLIFHNAGLWPARREYIYRDVEVK